MGCVPTDCSAAVDPSRTGALGSFLYMFCQTQFHCEIVAFAIPACFCINAVIAAATVGSTLLVLIVAGVVDGDVPDVVDAEAPAAESHCEHVAF